MPCVVRATLFASSVALGQSLISTGAAGWMAQGIAAVVVYVPPAGQIAIFMAFAALLTNFVSNAAAAAVATPIAIATAVELGLPLEPFVLAILFGANLSYATPMAYQTNLLIMNAAGYRFSDFVRVGVPLVVLMLVMGITGSATAQDKFKLGMMVGGNTCCEWMKAQGDVARALAEKMGWDYVELSNNNDPATALKNAQIMVQEGVGAMASSSEGLWLVKRDTNQLARLDTETAQFTDVVAAPGPVRSMSFGADSLWMVLAEEDTVARYGIDGDGPFTAGAGRNPTTALVTGGFLFVAARNDQSVQVLDPESLRPVQDPIPVGVNPIALAASADGAVWVTSLGDNTVTRIELR